MLGVINMQNESSLIYYVSLTHVVQIFSHVSPLTLYVLEFVMRLPYTLYTLHRYNALTHKLPDIYFYSSSFDLSLSPTFSLKMFVASKIM